MEIILRERVEKLGDRGDIVKVKAGYARNFLFPKRKAVLLTPHNVRQVEQEKSGLIRREAIAKKDSELLAQQLSELNLVFSRKVGENEVLYGSVTTMDVVQMLEEKGFEIERRKLNLEEPLKSLGKYEVPIKLHREVIALLKVEVLREE